MFRFTAGRIQRLCGGRVENGEAAIGDGGSCVSVRKDIDELINWFEANNPRASRTLQVCATPNTVRRFAKRMRNADGRIIRHGPYIYRGREIVPIRKPRNQQPLQPEQIEATTLSGEPL
jgi:hypothetical protein